jgi:hypothetical protein
VFCAPRIPYFNDFSMALPPKVLGRLAKTPIREEKYFASYKTNENRHSIVRSPSPLNIRDTETITPAKSNLMVKGAAFGYL